MPYRDSKLTRLLQDNLGGTAKTYLIATVGPCHADYAETLSTLLFASRCMRVAATPVKHAEVDYAALAARLQMRIAGAEGDFLRRQADLQASFEGKQAALEQEVRQQRARAEAAERRAREAEARADAATGALGAMERRAVAAESRLGEGSGGAGYPPSSGGSAGLVSAGAPGIVHPGPWLPAIRKLWGALSEAHEAATQQLKLCQQSVGDSRAQWAASQAEDARLEAGSRREAAAMAAMDDVAAPARFGPHLPVVRRSERKGRLASLGTEDVPDPSAGEAWGDASGGGGDAGGGAGGGDEEEEEEDVVVLEDPEDEDETTGRGGAKPSRAPAHRVPGTSREALAAQLAEVLEPVVRGHAEQGGLQGGRDVSAAAAEDLCGLAARLGRRVEAATRALGEHARGQTGSLHSVKLELAESEAQRRQREEELTNQSYVLKYLVDVNARLRVLRQQQEDSDAAASLGATSSPGALDRVMRRRQDEH